MGCWDEVDRWSFATRLARGELTCHDGPPLPDELRKRLLRETDKSRGLKRQTILDKADVQSARVSP
jgi:hypothetical protein